MFVLDNFCSTYQLCRYEEVIQLCGKTLDSAKKNAYPLDAGCKSRIWIIHNSQKVSTSKYGDAQ